MATDHDSIDHAHAAARHPTVLARDDRGRLSWQRPAEAPAPPLWHILLVALGVLAALFVINVLNDWRAAVRLEHIREDIRQNIVTLATAANEYMAANNVRTVSEQQLVGPGKLLPKQPTPVIGENYSKLVFSLDIPYVTIREPDSKWLDFDIHWHKAGTPEFVSPPIAFEKDADDVSSASGVGF